MIGGTAIGLLALGLGLYFFKKRNNTEILTTSGEKPIVQEKQLTFNEKFIKTMNEIRLKLDESDEKLTPQILKQIYRGQYYLANEEAK